MVKRSSAEGSHHSGTNGKSTLGVDSANCNRERAAVLPLQRIAKRSFDVVVAIIGLSLFSPVLLLSSIAIKLDSRGPIIYSKVRHSYGNKTFRIFTFRCAATEIIEKVVQTVRRDASVTRIGGILRSSGLDKFPQLINVLRGEMSIVGPRPCTTPPGLIFEEQIALIARRPNVRPGLTGLAQVNGCGDVSNSLKMIRRIDYDLYCVENWSFRLDMKIILMTLCSKKACASTEWTNDR